MLVFLKYFFLLILFLIVIGIIFEQYSRWKLEKRIMADRTFIEINTKKLHYVKKGSGKCTIVFQSGMGSNHYIWHTIQEELSKYAVTISYDRNALLFSENANLPVTNEQVTEELEQLLKKTNCPKPYILVGHSMAGIYLRRFIHKHQDDIKGIVFVEAAHPKQIEKSSQELINSIKPPPRWFIKAAIHTGLYRTLFTFMPLSLEIPLHHPLGVIEKDYFYKSVDKLLEEVKMDKQNFKDAEQFNDFGAIPLTIIMGTNDNRYQNIKNQKLKKEYKELVYEVQHDLLKLSSESKLLEATKSGHIVQINDAQLIIEQIKQML